MTDRDKDEPLPPLPDQLKGTLADPAAYPRYYVNIESNAPIRKLSFDDIQELLVGEDKWIPYETDRFLWKTERVSKEEFDEAVKEWMKFLRERMESARKKEKK